MQKTLIFIVILILIVFGGYFVFKGRVTAPTKEEPPLVGPNAVPQPQANPESSFETAPEPAPEKTAKITVVGTEFKFEPAVITAKTGEKIKLTFKNSGKAGHDLVFDKLGVRTKLVFSGASETIEFTAPAKGSYSFICSVPGHKEAGMTGTLKVE